jgi:hypothetical protein
MITQGRAMIAWPCHALRLLPANPYTYRLTGLRYPQSLIFAGFSVFACHFAAKNFLHGGGRAEPNGPTAAERLHKLFIFL